MSEIEQVLARLDGIEGMLATLLERKVEKGPEYLSPEEVAVALHRKPYTVRESGAAGVHCLRAGLERPAANPRGRASAIAGRRRIAPSAESLA